MFRLKLSLLITLVSIHNVIDANQILYFDLKIPHSDVNQLARFFWIFPGTKWCGPGNIANDFLDIGAFKETDKCCRAHDNCDNISSGGSKDGLSNHKPFTVLHCDCDKEFYDCLKASKEDVSTIIGETYFLIQNQCYRKDHPIKDCKKYDNQIFARCVEYNLDITKDQTYQWFDLPHFSEKVFQNNTKTVINFGAKNIEEIANNEV